ncbi:MAG: methyltransferase domain-containing protein, partial [Acidimicrobiales bacterium]
MLKRVAVTAVGVDPSSLMLEAAARRVGASLAQGSGERLPFADDVFSGCW